MSLLLRKIQTQKWGKTHKWIPENELQADVLQDLQPKANQLSVFVISDDRSNLERVVAALAVAGTNRIDNLDYALFDERNISDLQIRIKPNKGETPDDGVNGWHRDLTELTVGKVVGLSEVIRACPERKRIPEKRVRQLVAESIFHGHIDRSKLTKLSPEQTVKLNNELIKLGGSPISVTVVPVTKPSLTSVGRFMFMGLIGWVLIANINRSTRKSARLARLLRPLRSLLSRIFS